MGKEELQALEQALCRAVLAAVHELPHSFGFAKTISMLKGTKSRYVFAQGLHEASSYGSFASFSADQLRAVLDSLVAAELLTVEKVNNASMPFPMPVLKVTEKGKTFLGKKSKMQIETELFRAPEVPKVDPAAMHRFDRLRKLRTAIAYADDVPAYSLCSDAVLMEIASRAPSDLGELYEIGAPDRFIENYGERFLKEIANVKVP
jgi:ATP-dependent DNA helicase RecQ